MRLQMRWCSARWSSARYKPQYSKGTVGRSPRRAETSQSTIKTLAPHARFLADCGLALRVDAVLLEVLLPFGEAVVGEL